MNFSVSRWDSKIQTEALRLLNTYKVKQVSMLLRDVDQRRRCQHGGQCASARTCGYARAELLENGRQMLNLYLAEKGYSAEDVEKMCAAWVKSCLLQVTLWSHPCVKVGDF